MHIARAFRGFVKKEKSWFVVLQKKTKKQKKYCLWTEEKKTKWKKGESIEIWSHFLLCFVKIE